MINSFNNRSLLYFCLLALKFSIAFLPQSVLAQSKDSELMKRIDSNVLQKMKSGNIPGLSLVIVNGSNTVIRSYGTQDVERKLSVKPSTLFELGSCSKAFTSLVVLILEKEKLINLDDGVSKYIPWFKLYYKDKAREITLKQLLHHTSGIPWKTISNIPIDSSTSALEHTVKSVLGVKLAHKPGTVYEYATVNYDILALVVQKVSGKRFEEVVQEKIFGELKMSSSSFNHPLPPLELATGYKIGFFYPRKYDAPVYRGNNAAGYVLSNAEDMAKWLRFQLGQSPSPLFDLAKQTQQRDPTVGLHDMAAYGMGWEISLKGDNIIFHGGNNPNYSSFVLFRPDKKKGIVVLSNSNSSYTPIIADDVFKIISGQEVQEKINAPDRNDKAYSILSIIICIYILIVLAYLVMILVDIRYKRRIFSKLSWSALSKYTISLILIIPFLFGFYLFPSALAGFTWQATIVWSPVSFMVLIALTLFAILITYLVNLCSLLFPHKDEIRQVAPKIILLSMLSGVANMVLIILITSSLGNSVEVEYLVLYFTLALVLYIFGRKFVQMSLIKLTRKAVFEIRMGLFEKIFSTSYQKFEKINRGRIYTVLNEDVGTVGESTNMFVMLITSIFTALCAFLYLATIAFWATTITLILIATLAAVYYFVSESTNKFYEEARDTRNVFMRLTNGMIDGFKEISLHRNKKLEYKADVAEAANIYKEKISIAGIRFLYAFLVGESLFIILLGAISFALPKLFPDILETTIMSFIIVLLYLIGPINRILGAVPAIMQLKIAWNRIHQFLDEIPSNLDLNAEPEPLHAHVNTITAEGLTFKYEDAGKTTFGVGPINFDASAGEIIFIIGGNGSGKTTLAKLITGLYEPDEGEIKINDELVKGSQLSEYFSTVFSPAHLFDKLYNVDLEGRTEEIQRYLEILDLDKKVTIKEKIYSTINLSGGQRKRLSLLQCYLENSPIYLFDEWAADQDPEYRNFFYRTLLPQMKAKGKIIIAITHDDHYFDVADKVLKMKMGKLEFYSKQNPVIDMGNLTR